MALRVLNPGHFTTVQDHGRLGFRAWGVPVAGAFDRGSADLANALLGNPVECATLELTLVGGMYEAFAPLAVALAGAPMSTMCLARDGRDRVLTIPSCFALAHGDRLQLGGTPVGARTYLAVRGGWKTPVVLGSRSSETRLNAGDSIPADAGATLHRWIEPSSWIPPAAAPIRLIPGPDAAAGGRLDELLASEFRVGQNSDRMGLRLDAPPLPWPAEADRLSTPVAPGAIQLAGGAPLLLGVACGTMGGYPHLAHVISADLDRIGQLRPGDRIRFQRVTLADARQLDRADRETRAKRLLVIRASAADPSVIPNPTIDIG
jgi:biotin-dependent carboxylase-like uncharacterized protein